MTGTDPQPTNRRQEEWHGGSAHLSWHSSFWCLSSKERGNCRMQKPHSEGSSLTAFSTARFRQHRLLLISQRQLGQVACSSFSRASASRWMKQPAHMRCPLVHYGGKERSMRPPTLCWNRHSRGSPTPSHSSHPRLTCNQGGARSCFKSRWGQLGPFTPFLQALSPAHTVGAAGPCGRMVLHCNVPQVLDGSDALNHLVYTAALSL